jgi:hypothetical protein
MSKIRNADVENALKAEQIDAEKLRAQVDLAIKVGTHINDTLERSKE